MNIPGKDAGKTAKALGMVPHAEGGFFREIWRDEHVVKGNRAGTMRNASTSILFLLPQGGRSRLHRLASDETWIHNMGCPIAVIELEKNRPPRTTMVGPAGENMNKARHTVKAGTWFGAVPESGAGFSLVICTVTPGFDFSDFELGEKASLEREYPQAREVLDKLG